ncbi:ABC transporter substrate-binding protein [Streptomyces sp. DSM 44917]|uniref:ABC transporter substrate-binding protein n=1 Tax=Streptomyces boetiae TaxID=3075541 RepID=A0ABU2L4R0_9ACTN|nr:ABC transporter substrate-binding protein [Streptomyces sp. DSM 44917]MDT0306543.1 ABC transporter substrate-binding protein [Streptomyces sp. DSM 44917]
MRPLEEADPRRIGGYRLLRRLAEGRTGVVYLTRYADGGAAVLKLIRPEHAAAPGFRARFEADVAAARHVRASYLVTVRAADTAGGTIWAAYPYLPGPALPRALEAHGPLPARTVRVLGVTLAGALCAVHAAGLAHGDVRPGHVSLAADGGWLTGFGGSGTRGARPGFAAPEQTFARAPERERRRAQGRARARGEARAAAGDVFALGCVLALAASGRPPFGSGTNAELLLRTRAEAPDLADVPRELAEVVRACLEKNPAARPTADEVRMELATEGGARWLPDALAAEIEERAGRPLPSWEAPGSPRAAGRRAPGGRSGGGKTGGGKTGGGKPKGAKGEKAGAAKGGGRRSGGAGQGAASGSGEPEAESAPGGSGGGVAADHHPKAGHEARAAAVEDVPRRAGRRGLLLGSGAVGLAGLATAWRLMPGPRSPAATGEERGGTYAIGLHADLSGPHARYGRGQWRGAGMAVDELSRNGGLPFGLRLTQADDGGDPDRAREVAARLAADPSVIAVIGPTADPVARAAAEVYAAQGVPLLALSVGSFGPREGLSTLLHARPNTATLGLAVPACLAGEGRPLRVGVVDDLAAASYSRETVRAVTATAGGSGAELVTMELRADERDFAGMARRLAAERVEAVVWGGYAEGAGRLARELRTAGFAGRCLATQEALDPAFFEHAGRAQRQWRFLASYTDARGDEGARRFGAVYRERFDEEAGPYAAEGYDAARLVAKALRQAAGEGGRVGREPLLERLRGTHYRGVARELAFDHAGDYAGAGPLGYLYEAEDDAFHFRGVAPFPGASGEAIPGDPL